MRARLFTVGLLLVTVALARTGARQLKPETRAAFERYVELTESRMEDEVGGRAAFLWVDRQPSADQSALRAKLTRGEVVSARLETRDGPRRIDPGAGLIHHWIGTVLVPGATLERVAAFVQDYPRYPEVFAPLIQRTAVIDTAPERFDVAMRTSMKKVLTVVIDADYRIEYRTLSPTRLYTRNVATNVHEVHDAGAPKERRTPADQTSGFLWRLNTYCSFEQRTEGTYEQCETVSLTRDAPFGLGWIVKPFVNGIPRETLEFTLGRVRQAVIGGF